MCSSPSVPEPPPAPPKLQAPRFADESVQMAGEAERRRRAGGGQNRTILTSGLGVTNAADTAVKTVLGG